jgi:hypothetical protein
VVVSATFAEPVGYAVPFRQSTHSVAQIMPLQGNTVVQRDATDINPNLQRRIVHYSTREASGTIIVDPTSTYLCFPKMSSGVDSPARVESSHRETRCFRSFMPLECSSVT